MQRSLGHNLINGGAEGPRKRDRDEGEGNRGAEAGAVLGGGQGPRPPIRKSGPVSPRCSVKRLQCAIFVLITIFCLAFSAFSGADFE